MDSPHDSHSGPASPSAAGAGASASRYELQKRRDWNTFGQYLRNRKPPLSMARCGGADVLEFLRYLDQFGKTKVHTQGCPFFGHPNPPAPCPCPLRQAWGSLEALVGRLRAAYEENGGRPESNPFAARSVRLYLREVREHQARARGLSYEKKKHKKPQNQPEQQPPPPVKTSEDSDLNREKTEIISLCKEKDNKVKTSEDSDLNREKTEVISWKEKDNKVKTSEDSGLNREKTEVISLWKEKDNIGLSPLL